MPNYDIEDPSEQHKEPAAGLFEAMTEKNHKDAPEGPRPLPPSGKRGISDWFSLSAKPADDVTPGMRKVITALRVLALVILVVFLLSIFSGNN